MDAGSFIGAYRACAGISDAALICHVPVGCRYSASFFGSVSCQSKVMHSCSMIQEHEVVFGGEERLSRTVLKACEAYDAPLAIVLSGDVPSIIGDDVSGVPGLLPERRIILVEALGFKGRMADGYEQGLIQLAGAMEECAVSARSVNLIGFCPDDFKVAADIRELRRCLGRMGVRVNCAISRCTAGELARAPAAELNVVLGQGRGLAEKMKKDYGTPFIEAAYPYGLAGTAEFLDRIAAFFSIAGHPEVPLSPFRDSYQYLQAVAGKPVRVVGDFHADPMGGFLRDDLGMEVEGQAFSGEDRHEFDKNAIEGESVLLMGSSFERELAEKMNVPLVRYTYPVFDRVAVSDGAPYAGYRGAALLVEDILNAMIGYDYAGRGY